MTLRLMHVFPSFNPGGAQTRFVTLANHFGPKLHHLIVAMDGKTDSARSLKPNVNFRCLDVPSRKNTATGNLRRFRAALKSEQPDILITHNWGAIEWALANWGTGIRHVHIEDGFGPDEARGQHARRVFARRIVLRRSTVVVPSRTLERIARETWHIAPSRLRYVPNGIDLSRFARAPADRNPYDFPLIGTVCALRAEKNLPRLLRAFAATTAQIPCRLKIVGDGPERDALAALAQTLGVADRVHFAGHQADPAPAYSRFDIFALTSDTEQMPYTVIEAMAAQCPVVATDVGDIALMVAPANRPFIVPKDEQAVSAALLKLLSDPSLREDIGAANLKTAQQNFDQDAMFRAFAEIYEAPELVAT